MSLPAVLAAAKISLATASAGPAASAFEGTFTTLWRPCLINHEGPSHERSSIAGLDRLRRKCVIIDLDETESPGLSAEAIPEDIHAINMNASFLEEGLQVSFCRLVG